MVMSLQGTVYRATSAYSHWGASTTGTGACLDVDGPQEEAPTPAPRAAPAAPVAPIAGANIPAARAPINTPVHTADATLQYNGGNYGHSYDSHDSNRAVYMGEATIIMGIVNGMTHSARVAWLCYISVQHPPLDMVACVPCYSQHVCFGQIAIQ